MPMTDLATFFGAGEVDSSLDDPPSLRIDSGRLGVRRLGSRRLGMIGAYD